jgi:hypothetical protein
MKKITSIFIAILLSGCAYSPFFGERISSINDRTSTQEALDIAGPSDGTTTLENGTKVYSYLSRSINGWNGYKNNYYIFTKNGRVIDVKKDTPWYEDFKTGKKIYPFIDQEELDRTEAEREKRYMERKSNRGSENIIIINNNN